MTETGFVRVSSNARVIPDARTPGEAIALLRAMRELPGHSFWEDNVSPADSGSEPFERVVGHRQVTDAHLLTLARRRGGVLATLDRGVADLLPSDPRAVELISS
jgi:predicted nucleic acid-binding protein